MITKGNEKNKRKEKKSVTFNQNSEIKRETIIIYIYPQGLININYKILKYQFLFIIITVYKFHNLIRKIIELTLQYLKTLILIYRL